MFTDNVHSAFAGAMATLVIGMILPASTATAEANRPMSGPRVNQEVVRAALANRRVFAASALQKDASHRAATATGSAATAPADVYANPNSTYPPSCLTDGTYAAQYSSTTDPNAQQVQVTTPIYDFNTQAYDLSETDTYTVWRVPCSGGVSAVLLEIDRPSGLSGVSSQYPTFPDVYAGSSSSPLYVRLPNDPNTVYSDTIPGSAVIDNTIYVLEYYSGSSSTQNDNYNAAFTLNFDTLTQDSSSNEIIATINVPAFSAASFNNYPSASNPMEISGYMSTNWSNPNQSGEGIVMQVYDGGDSATRILAFAWFTYDDNGLPFWLYGQVSFAIGTRSVTAPTVYFQGGSFAPSFAVASVPHPAWGNVTFTFPDCAHMNISYSGNASAVQGPNGSGSATFQRVANINSLNCS